MTASAVIGAVGIGQDVWNWTSPHLKGVKAGISTVHSWAGKESDTLVKIHKRVSSILELDILFTGITAVSTTHMLVKKIKEKNGEPCLFTKKFSDWTYDDGIFVVTYLSGVLEVANAIYEFAKDGASMIPKETFSVLGISYYVLSTAQRVENYRDTIEVTNKSAPEGLTKLLGKRVVKRIEDCKLDVQIRAKKVNQLIKQKRVLLRLDIVAGGSCTVAYTLLFVGTGGAVLPATLLGIAAAAKVGKIWCRDKYFNPTLDEISPDRENTLWESMCHTTGLDELFGWGERL